MNNGSEMNSSRSSRSVHIARISGILHSVHLHHAQEEVYKKKQADEEEHIVTAHHMYLRLTTFRRLARAYCNVWWATLALANLGHRTSMQI